MITLNLTAAVNRIREEREQLGLRFGEVTGLIRGAFGISMWAFGRAVQCASREFLTLKSVKWLKGSERTSHERC